MAVMAKNQSGGGGGKGKVRVAFRPNRLRPARDRSWTRQYRQHSFEEDESIQTESVRTKGELSRKRTVAKSPESEAPANLHPGVVIAMRGLIAEVDDGQRVWPCTIRRVLRTRRIQSRRAVTVGDRVHFRASTGRDSDQLEGVIEMVHPRLGELTRSTGGRTHVIAANVDQGLIVTSARQPIIKPHLIDRSLVACHAGGIEPVVCLNKVDLDEDGNGRQVLQRYEDLGYHTLVTSAVTGEGLDELRSTLQEKTTVLAGQSGVGKSSLLNALQPSLKLRVAEVSTLTEKGRHTTSTAHLLRLEFGGYVVDTPGIRTFDVGNIPAAEFEAYFVEFAPFLPNCKFPNCTHTHEEDCAVLEALDAGKIYPQRYDSYAKLFRGD